MKGNILKETKKDIFIVPLEKLTNKWEELLSLNNCFVCRKPFTSQNIQANNYRIAYYYLEGVQETNNLTHRSCWEQKDICAFCQKEIFTPFISVVSQPEKYHPDCWWVSQKINSSSCQIHSHPQIISLEVHSKKITAKLEDGREVSIPIDWLAKWALLKEVKPEQLKNYELDEKGYDIYFPDVDVDVHVRNFIDGLKTKCCC